MKREISKMKMPSRLKKVNLSSITGPYQLFGLSLLVVEGLLGYWLFRAQSAVERGFTGLVMVSIFFGLVYAVIRMTQREIKLVSPPGAEMSVKPPEGEATETEIASPAPETIPAPDRSYLINLPPEGWRVRELSSADLISEGIGIKDPTTKERLLTIGASSPLMKSRTYENGRTQKKSWWPEMIGLSEATCVHS